MKQIKNLEDKQYLQILTIPSQLGAILYFTVWTKPFCKVLQIQLLELKVPRLSPEPQLCRGMFFILPLEIPQLR